MGRSRPTVTRALALALTFLLLGGRLPVRAAEGATGSAVGRVTVLRKGMPAPADETWKVRFTSQAGATEPLEFGLRNGVYETPELPVGPYQVQVVDAFGQPVGDPQPVVLKPGAIRLDLRIELVKAARKGRGSDKGGRSRWKVVAIVGGAAAALALAAGGGGDDPAPASPSN